MIPREIYLKKLRLLKDQDLIKVITGVRRSGKSTLLESFRNEILSSGVNQEDILPFISFHTRLQNIYLHFQKKKTQIDYFVNFLTIQHFLKQSIYLNQPQN